MFACIVTSGARRRILSTYGWADSNMTLFFWQKIRYDHTTQIEQSKNVGVEEVAIDLDLYLFPYCSLRSASIIDQYIQL